MFSTNAEPGSNIRHLRPPAAGGTPEQSEDGLDERLIVAAQAGDLNAFNDLVTRHERAVFSVCMRLLRDASSAEDATQDTFIRAWGAIDSFRGGMVRPWLLRIATNRAYDVLRSRTRRPTWSLDAELFESQPEWTTQSHHEAPDTFATRSELAGFLEEALGELPDDQRLAIVLSDVQGYGYDDIANITGVAVGTVKSRISRGRSALRTLLRDNTQHRELFERYVRQSLQEAEAG
ncbi:MAG: sigma-70 family RNA polymerase sigma factor [Chloroflexia bacterium]|jgi:RNA polymerase sigma-70 factor (ECF subfamily)|nr:sigma-70 family RNA polymerase sigma factor [Chloroflexia bacterium]